MTSLLDVALQNAPSSPSSSQTVTVNLKLLLEVQNSLNALKELAESSHADLSAVTTRNNDSGILSSTNVTETPSSNGKPRSTGFPRASSPGSGPKKPNQNRKFLF